MPEPVIVARADHAISRRNIDPEALKVLYRLHENRHMAYLVGGGVRDLLLGRRPKDFDIGTDAHPYQIKRLFRNCWIIGRRFRLAHIKFGTKTIEVATFRKVVVEPPAGAAGEPPVEEAPVVVAASPESSADAAMIHRDNTFGTPEEDAFRRDFTINGLFYDIGTFSVIDYVGGLSDLEGRVVRSIGDPRVRFVEDPVRMLRAAVMAARLDFALDPLVIDAIDEHRQLILKAAPARLLEEYYKILRSGYAEATFHLLDKLGLLKLMTPELSSGPDAAWESLARLDRYRSRFPAAAPAEMTNAMLSGALLAPLGVLNRPHGHGRRSERDAQHERVNFGILPIARKDLDRINQVTQLVPKLLDADLSSKVARNLAHRPAFADALVWLEIFSDAPEVVDEWKQVRAVRGPADADAADPDAEGDAATAAAGPRKRRRRRRRRGRGAI